MGVGLASDFGKFGKTTLPELLVGARGGNSDYAGWIGIADQKLLGVV